MTAVGELITPTGVLVMTAEQMHADYERWLALRRKRPGIGYCIGSSDVPSLLDLDGVDTPVHLYRDKVLGIRKPSTERMQLGHDFEPTIAGIWCRNNRSVIDEIGLVANAERPWEQTTVDRRVVECPTIRGLRNGCGLETKRVAYVTAARWHAEVPDRILAQIADQLAVTGWPHMHYACDVGAEAIKQGIIWADRERQLIDYIRAEKAFYREKYLIPEVEPAWNTTEKAAKLIELDALTHPDRIGEIDIDGIGDLMEYADAQAAESAARKRKEQAKARLAQLADGREIVTFGGERAWWYGTSTRTGVDLDVLAERYPDAYHDPDVVSETVSHPIYIDKSYKVRQS